MDPDLLSPELPLPRRPCEPGLGLGKPFISGQEIIKERVTIDGGDYDRSYFNRREGPRRGLGFGNGQLGGYNGFGEKRGLGY